MLFYSRLESRSENFTCTFVRVRKMPCKLLQFLKPPFLESMTMIFFLYFYSISISIGAELKNGL